MVKRFNPSKNIRCCGIFNFREPEVDPVDALFAFFILPPFRCGELPLQGVYRKRKQKAIVKFNYLRLGVKPLTTGRLTYSLK